MDERNKAELATSSQAEPSKAGVSEGEIGQRRLLPLEGKVESGAAWRLRVPLKAERVTLRKEITVFEEVVVRRRPIQEQKRFEDRVSVEQVRVEARGDVEVAREDQIESGPGRHERLP